MYIFTPKNSSNSSSRSPKSYSSKKINWKKTFRFFAFLSVSGMFFVIGIFAWFWKDLPSPDKLHTRVIAESTKIYDRSGNHLLYEIHGEEKRTQIPYSEMPETVRRATIALEDQDFYQHYGIKLSSIFRAVFKDMITLGKAQGGSTITQQLIKNSMLSNERTWTRKIKEAILAIELEQKFSKDKILEMYLNEIPYGSNAYGIEAAAQTFFGKHAKDLDLPESALLASLPQAPTHYSPYGSYPEDLVARQQFALKKMYELGYITEDQYNQAKEVDILARISPYRENINAPHFVMYIKDYLSKKYGEQALEEGGLKVITTLDWNKQQAAEKAVREGAEKNVRYKAENAALVAIDPKTGQILAMVGSKNYFDKAIDGQVNVAIRDRQPGSSFKPYVYLTAFTKGYTPETMLWDVDTNFSTDDGKSYNPKNYDGKNRGPVLMKEALAMSLNVPAVETLYLAGVKNSIETAHKLGITTLKDPDRLGLSLVLGGGEVKLLDHVNAYATLATGGIYHQKTAILKISDSQNNILEEYKNTSGDRVIEEKYIAMLDHVMSTNDYRAPVFGQNNPLKFDGRAVAAKTGTTNEWRDGWTMGYTPSLAVGVWAGNNNNSVMAQGADGVYTAAPIWRAFMDEALKNYSIEDFPKYEKEETGKAVLDGKSKEEIQVCKIKKDKYCLANSACPSKDIETKKYVLTHNILYYVDKDNPRGDQPTDPEKDPQYKNWEKAVEKWIDDNDDYAKSDPPENECKSKDFDLSGTNVFISSPNDGTTITSSSFTISANASSDKNIKKISLQINGSEVASEKNDSLSYEYTVPDDKKNTDLEIKVTATDDKGDSDSEKITVHTNIQ